MIYKETLKDLEVGDKVFLSCRTNECIREVEKITPKGNIKAGGILFNEYGNEKGGDVWNKWRIQPLTEELHKQLIKKSTIKKAYKIMKDFPIEKMNIEIAVKILELLGKGGD